MRHTNLPTLFVITISTLIAMSLITIQPVPAYAQALLDDMPDLSGTNIYFSEVNGELSQFDRSDEGISRFAGLLRLAGANLFTLEWRKGIPSDADLIVIPGAQADPSAEDTARLWSYVQRGGRVLILLDAVDARGTSSRAFGSRGFFELTWSELGVRARPDVIVTPGELVSVDVTITDRNGDVDFTFTGDAPLLDTAFTTSVFDETHPITADIVASLSEGDEDALPNLTNLFLDEARSIELDASLDLGMLTPLIFTSNPEQYGETDFNLYNTTGFSEYNIGEDSQLGTLILGAAYDDSVNDARLVLLGSSELLRNGSGFQVSPSYSGSFVFPLNAQLMLNSVAWLLGRDAVLLDLPTPINTATPTITPTMLPTATQTPMPTATPASEDVEAATEEVTEEAAAGA